MKNLVFLLFLAVLAFAVIGYWQEWFKIEGVPSGEGHRRLQIDINTTKIKSDFDRGAERVQDGISHVKDGAEKAKDAASKIEVPSQPNNTKKSNDSSFFEFLGRIGEKSGTKK